MISGCGRMSARGLLLVFPLFSLLPWLAAGCVTRDPAPALARPEAPYLAVQKPVPPGQDRIYLLASIPGRILIRNDCVLFERMDGAVVLPVFESGTGAGTDRRGAWVFDPYSSAHSRDGSRVAAGGGGGETIEDLRRRNILAKPIPRRCLESLSVQSAIVLNPGIEPAP